MLMTCKSQENIIFKGCNVVRLHLKEFPKNIYTKPATGKNSANLCIKECVYKIDVPSWFMTWFKILPSGDWKNKYRSTYNCVNSETNYNLDFLPLFNKNYESVQQ